MGLWEKVVPSEKPRTECIRCGECCMRSSPTLQGADRALVCEDFIAKQNVYTIRKGELVWDNVMQALTVTSQEMIKIKEKSEGGCIYYDNEGRACMVYEKRPVQCFALACWDIREFLKVYKEPKLTRKDLVMDGVLLSLLEAHEKRCGYDVIEGHVKAIEKEGEQAVEALIELLKFDFALRPFLSGKLGLPMEEMDFLLGRPLTETLVMFGLKVERQTDGSFFLTASESVPGREGA